MTYSMSVLYVNVLNNNQKLEWCSLVILKLHKEVESEEIHLCWFYIQVKIGAVLIYLSYNESAK